jgi:hypothetical protein
LRTPLDSVRRALVAGALALAVAAVAAGPASAAPKKLTLSLAPAGAASVSQGDAFVFNAHLASDESFAQGVFFDLIAPNGQSVTFVRQIAVVPPGASTDINAKVTPAQWFSQLGTYTIRASLDGQHIGDPLAFTVTKPKVTAPTFADVSAAAGVATTIRSPACGHWTNGAAWADVNGDGRLDLFVTRQIDGAQLFIQQANRKFTEEAAARGVSVPGFVALGAVFADYDNDGRPDLTVVGDGVPYLFHNDGTGHFTDVSGASGIDNGANFSGVSASWADYDNDGKLDLYVVAHSRCQGDVTLNSLLYQPDRLWHNNGNGTFTDVTGFLGNYATATIGAGFQAAWFDYNGDGRQDLYLANDYLGRTPDRNHFWRNDGANPNGGWNFTDISVDSGSAYSMNSMGVGIGDYDRDGRLDLAISNWGANRLLHNNGDWTFTDTAAATGVERTFQRAMRRTVTWGPEFGDFNNDAWEDLYVAAGFLVGYLTEDDAPQANEVFVNDRHGKFYDLSATSGADDNGQSRGVASADYDKDGRLDLYVVNQGGAPHLFKNTTKLPKYTHWLEVNTVGTGSNRDGCGTRLVISYSKQTQLRQVYCGGTSVGSGSSKIAHFGIAPDRKLKTVALEVTWPSGIKQTLKSVKIDRLITISEPKA